jgi:hypothetical protein
MSTIRVSTSAKSKSLIPLYVVTDPGSLERCRPRCLTAPARAADVGSVEKLRLSGAAAGPAPWLSLAALIAAAIVLSWTAAAAGDVAIAVVAMAAIAGFWLIVPKGSSSPQLPGWIALPMIPAFVAVLSLPALFGMIDHDLIAIGYAVGFILWFQLGLWLADTFEPIRPAGAEPGTAPALSTTRKARLVALVVIVTGLFSALVYGVIEHDGESDSAAAATAGGFYPPESPTAGPMTPELTEYAAAIDRACALNFNSTLALQTQVEQRARRDSWPNAKTLAAIQALWAENQRSLAADVRTLGAPPARPDLLDAWLGNVERRSDLFAAMAAANRSGEPQAAAGAWEKIERLKRAADRLGRDFGLRICTSN